MAQEDSNLFSLLSLRLRPAGVLILYDQASQKETLANHVEGNSKKEASHCRFWQLEPKPDHLMTIVSYTNPFHKQMTLRVLKLLEQTILP